MKSVFGVYWCFLKYREDSKRYLNSLHVVVHGGGRKMYINVPFLGMHQFTHLPGKDKRAKEKKNQPCDKKTINNRSLCCCVTFHVIWKYFFQNLRAFHKSSQKHYFFLCLFKAKQSSTLAVCLSFFSSLKKKKKKFWEFHFSIHCSPGQSKALFYIDVKIFTKIRVSFLYCSN